MIGLLAHTQWELALDRVHTRDGATMTTRTNNAGPPLLLLVNSLHHYQLVLRTSRLPNMSLCVHAFIIVNVQVKV